MIVIEGLEWTQDEQAASATSHGDVLSLRFGAAPAEGAVEGVDYHLVSQGETLSDIALHYLGDIRYAGDLARLNGLADPDRLTPGQTIRLR